MQGIHNDFAITFPYPQNRLIITNGQNAGRPNFIMQSKPALINSPLRFNDICERKNITISPLNHFIRLKITGSLAIQPGAANDAAPEARRKGQSRKAK